MSVSPSKQWLDKAAEDLTVARLVLSEGHTSHACFLSQQSIEKALKGFLLDRSNAYPRTHKLVDLLIACTALEPTLGQFEPICIRIDEYYIPTRYPDSIPGSGPEGIPSQAKAEEAVAAAKDILSFISHRLA